MELTTPQAPVRVVIVDDDPLVRSGLRLILGGHDDIDLVGEAVDGIDADDVITRARPDVVLMDIRMPRRDGLEATTRALARRPDLMVVVLTTFEADDLVLGALQRGARGFLLKDTPPHELVQAVLAVARGRSILSPSVLDRVIAAATGTGDSESAAEHEEARRRLALLTDREREVATAVAAGTSNAEIAASLFVSIATVKTHLGNAYAKLGVGNRVQLTLAVHTAQRRRSSQDDPGRG